MSTKKPITAPNQSFGEAVFIYLTLFIFNFCYAIPLLLKPMDTEGDAYGRAQVYSFWESGVFSMDGNVWLPLYQTFIGLTQFLPGDEIMTPRVLALVVSCVVPILVFLLTKKLTKQTGISFVTALLYILFPLFREIGVVTLTETFFLTLFLGALYSLLNRRYLWFGGMFFLSQMTRFEAWFAIPWLVTITAFFKTLSRTTKIMVISLCMAFPLLYSVSSYLSHGNGAEYLHQMNQMALVRAIEGRNNFPVAVRGWSDRFWNVFPTGFVVLAAVGFMAFLRQKRAAKTDDFSEQFVFGVLPLMLFLMLPIQVFLPFRDWLPTRYILIPTTLLFPLIGLGLQYVLTTWSWRRFWQWYLLAILFTGFEVYSLSITTHHQLSTYSTTQFTELYQTVEYQLKNLLTLDPETRIYVFKANIQDPEIPDPDIEFVRYFLFPQEPEVQYIDEARLTEVITKSPGKKIIIATKIHFFPSDFAFKTIFKGENYQFLLAE